MFNKIAQATNVKLVTGSLLEGNVTFQFLLNGVFAELAVNSHIQLVDNGYPSITANVRHKDTDVSIFFSQILHAEERAQLITCLETLDKKALNERRSKATELAKLIGLWE